MSTEIPTKTYAVLAIVLAKNPTLCTVIEFTQQVEDS